MFVFLNKNRPHTSVELKDQIREEIAAAMMCKKKKNATEEFDENRLHQCIPGCWGGQRGEIVFLIKPQMMYRIKYNKSHICKSRRTPYSSSLLDFNNKLCISKKIIEKFNRATYLDTSNVISVPLPIPSVYAW